MPVGSSIVCCECLCQWLSTTENTKCPCCYEDHLRDCDTIKDFLAMYEFMSESSKTKVCLWCDGYCDDNENCQSPSQKRRKKDESAPTSKHAEKEKEVDDVALELKELHSSDHSYSDPLWARMIFSGLNFRMQTPPQVPMITGIAPAQVPKRSVEGTVTNCSCESHEQSVCTRWGVYYAGAIHYN